MSKPSTDSAAIKRLLDAVVANGWKLDIVADGEDEISISTVKEALEAITAVDAAHVFLEHKDGRMGHIFFVLGNDPEEVAADYSTNLSDDIEPVTDLWWGRGV